MPVFAPWERLSFFFQRVQEEAGTGAGAGGGGADAEARRTAAEALRATLLDALRYLAVPRAAAFVTLAQRAQGVLLPRLERQDPRLHAPPDEPLVRFLARALVLNAGGGGDVPLPLLAAELPPFNAARLPAALIAALPAAGAGAAPGPSGAEGSGAAPSPQPLLLSFVGQVYSGGMREEVVALAVNTLGERFLHHYESNADRPGANFVPAPLPGAVREMFERNGFATAEGKADVAASAASAAVLAGSTAPTNSALAAKAAAATAQADEAAAAAGEGWRNVMARSLFSLAPSGSNPSSFRLYEALQLGVVPIFLFEDSQEQAWLPYHAWHERDGAFPAATWRASDEASGLRLWHKVAIVVPVSRLPELLEVLPALGANATYMAGKRALIRAARDQFFTYGAVVRHLWRLMDDPEAADLKCQQPPVAFF